MRHELSGAVPRQFGLVGLSAYLQRLRRTIASVASAAWHRISPSKMGLAILAILSGTAIVLGAKFVFCVHGLLKLADVGSNVPLGPGTLGGGGAGGGGVGHRPNRPPKKGGGKSPQTPNPCANQEQAVKEAKSNAATLKNQRDQYETEMTKDLKDFNSDTTDAKRWLDSLKREADTTILANPASTLLNGLPSDLSQITPRQIQDVLDLNLPDGQMFVNAVRSLQKAFDDWTKAKANAQNASEAYQTALQQVAQAQQDLADCQASQGGDASAGNSTGDSVGATA